MKTSNKVKIDGNFSRQADKSQILASKPHKRAWVHLRYGLEQGAGLVLLSGPEGVGKTSLLNVLYDEFRHENVKALKLLTSDIAEDGLLNTLARAIEPKILQANAIDQFKYLSDIHRFMTLSKKKVLVFIDDAENLLPADLNVLNSILAHEHLQHCIQVVLCGTDDFLYMISLNEFTALKEAVMISYELMPMSDQDSLTFINNQLKILNLNPQEPINDIQLVEIIEKSHGLPEQIINNLIALSPVSTLDPEPELVEPIVSNHEEENKNKNYIDTDFVVATNEEIFNTDEEFETDDVPVEEKPNRWFNKESIFTVSLAYVASLVISYGVLFVDTKFNQLPPDRAVNTLVENKIPEPTKVAKAVLPTPVDEILNSIDENNISKHELTEVNDTPIIAEVENEIVEDTSDTIAIDKNPTPSTEFDVASNDIEATLNSDKPEETSPFTELEADLRERDALAAKLEAEVLALFEASRGNSTDESGFMEDLDEVVLNPANFSSDPIDDLSLNALVSQFEVAYRFGDLEKIDQLVSEEVSSNNISGKEKFVTEYEKLFDITISRKIQLYDMNWKTSGDSSIGEGAFKVAINEKGSNTIGRYNGTIIIRITEQHNQLKISEILYNYENL